MTKISTRRFQRQTDLPKSLNRLCMGLIVSGKALA